MALGAACDPVAGDGACDGVACNPVACELVIVHDVYCVLLLYNVACSDEVLKILEAMYIPP